MATIVLKTGWDNQMSGNYEKYFPHESVRESQDYAIKKILEAYSEGKRFVILEAGTGVGKSAIGLTVARYLNSTVPLTEAYEAGAWFVTTQKILQEQYVSDFGGTKGGMKSIKSSTNYTCSFHKKNTCSQSQQLLRTADRDSRFFKACTFSCKYKEEKKKYIESPESVTNFPYFMTEAAYSGKITPRKFLVVDEHFRADRTAGTGRSLAGVPSPPPLWTSMLSWNLLLLLL